jgi:hypothetical protein
VTILKGPEARKQEIAPRVEPGAAQNEIGVTPQLTQLRLIVTDSVDRPKWG